jgi:hypothetical protein
MRNQEKQVSVFNPLTEEYLPAAMIMHESACDRYHASKLSCGAKRTLPKIKKSNNSKIFDPRAQNYLVRIRDMNLTSLTAPQTTAGT